MTSLTRKDVIATLGPLDDVTLASILASGASTEELAEVQAWLENDEPMINAGKPLASGRVGASWISSPRSKRRKKRRTQPLCVDLR